MNLRASAERVEANRRFKDRFNYSPPSLSPRKEDDVPPRVELTPEYIAEREAKRNEKLAENAKADTYFFNGVPN